VRILRREEAIVGTEDMARTRRVNQPTDRGTHLIEIWAPPA
jgi:hypothetical protein